MEVKRFKKEGQFWIPISASKSISNRWLILEFLSGMKFNIQNCSSADDTQLLKLLLHQIREGKQDIFYCENAGTVARFLVPLLTTIPGKHIITGSERMQQRPILPLVNALCYLGGDIRFIKNNQCLPLEIIGKTLKGGSVKIPGNVSSQFISALMLVAPTLENGLVIHISPPILSESYIEMTKSILLEMNIPVYYGENTIIIPNSSISPYSITIENDWSSASYFYNWVAFSDGLELHINGLFSHSKQGDWIISEIYEDLGVHTTFTQHGIILNKKAVSKTSIEYDFSRCPDLVPTVAVGCAGLQIQAVLKGLTTLPYKETNRITALANELRNLNIDVEILPESLKIQPKPMQYIRRTFTKTYFDHRIAMAFATLGMLYNFIDIENPEIVSKSFPEYWNAITHFKY